MAAWEASWRSRCAHLPLFHILNGQRKIFRGVTRQLSSASAEEHVPVLIVGAGPVGLVLSILLAKLGVKCAVIERSQQFSQHPQAHFINNRTMEVFRKLDGLSGEIEELQPSVEQWRRFIYCTSLSGTVLGTVDHMQPNDFKQTRSPTCVAHFSQHRLVPLLLKRLENLGFTICGGDDPSNEGYRNFGSWIRKINLGHECFSINPTTDGIRATIYCVKNGSKVMRNIHCRFLIGADGAGSTVRKLMGINLKGEQDMQKLISVHFMSKELGHFLSEKRPGMLYFVFNPNIIGVVVAHDLKEGEFVVQIPFYPPQQRFEDFSNEVAKLIDLDEEDDKQPKQPYLDRMSKRRMKDAKIYYPTRNDPDSVEIFYFDMECLDPFSYLSSPIMNFYIRHLQRPESLKPTQRNSYHFFNTYFYSKLDEALCDQENGDSLVKLRRWLKGVNIFEKAYVFLPIYYSLHWSLAIICFPAKEDKSGPFVLHLDSLGLHTSNTIFQNIQSFLKIEWDHLNQTGLPDNLPIEDSTWITLINKIENRKIQVPQQDNSYDCGLFVLFFIERFIKDAPARIRKEDLNMFGRKWFRPAEASRLRHSIKCLLEKHFEDMTNER